MEKRYETPKYNIGKIATAALAGLAGLVLFTGCAPKRDSWSWCNTSEQMSQTAKSADLATEAATKGIFED